jgi:hypothetical protein
MNAKLAALLGAIVASVVLGGCVAESADEDEGPTAQTAAAVDPTPLKNPVGTPTPPPKDPLPISGIAADPADPDPSPWDPPNATVSSQPGAPQPVPNH